MDTHLKIGWLLALGFLAVKGAAVGAPAWQNLIACENGSGTKYHVKTTYDRGILPQKNKRYSLRGQGALLRINSEKAQIPGYTDLETGLDIQLSRTDSFLSFFVEIKSENGLTILRRYENDKAELHQYIYNAVSQSKDPGAAVPGETVNGDGGKWETTVLKCKPQ